MPVPKMCGPAVAAAEKRKLPLPLMASSSSAPPSEKQPRRCDDVAVEPLQPLDMRRSRPSVIRRCSAAVQPMPEEHEPPLPARLLRSSTTTVTGMTGIRGASDQPDPAVEAHFRRSLGPQYAALFAGPAEAAGSALTVDDHFARALGPDTWLRLQDGLTSS
ncbi:transcription cofactor vestigial-like protein 4 [Dermacentor variabilis]|uniref:transcription cofactor vestigial-like protein 4 n=1 Tax=Dermacentor variabilis TaxID=34621 RepID=UPI003F5B66AE